MIVLITRLMRISVTLSSDMEMGQFLLSYVVIAIKYLMNSMESQSELFLIHLVNSKPSF